MRSVRGLDRQRHHPRTSYGMSDGGGVGFRVWASLNPALHHTAASVRWPAPGGSTEKRGSPQRQARCGNAKLRQAPPSHLQKFCGTKQRRCSVLGLRAGCPFRPQKACKHGETMRWDKKQCVEKAQGLRHRGYEVIKKPAAEQEESASAWSYPNARDDQRPHCTAGARQR